MKTVNGTIAVWRWTIFRKTWHLLVRSIQEAQADKVPRMAAAIAFYTAVSIAPLMMILIVIAGFVWGTEESVQAELLSYVSRIVNPRAAVFISTVLENANRPSTGSIAGLVSIATLFWGATNTFNHIRRSLNDIWEVPSEDENGVMQFVRARLFSFAMVLIIVFLLLVSLVFSTLLNAPLLGLDRELPGMQWIWQSTNVLISLLVVTLITAAIFRVLPEADISWRDVWLGATVTALLFTIGQMLLSFYLSRIGSTYGAAGSVIAFLFWVYFSAQALLFGAEIAKVFTDARLLTETAQRRLAAQSTPTENPDTGPVGEPERVKASTEPAQPRSHIRS